MYYETPPLNPKPNLHYIPNTKFTGSLATSKQKWEHFRNLSCSLRLSYLPIPEESGLIAPTHILAVTAASTAVPLLSSTFTAISEHTVSSVATDATRMDNNAHAKGFREIKPPLKPTGIKQWRRLLHNQCNNQRDQQTQDEYANGDYTSCDRKTGSCITALFRLAFA